ncbi:site-2 protease family protein [Candidatus Falkowbacteria bacterium CG10_big_fil_rev_8_21_14_0_10_43_11]|uniref:Site-2 protease family protein n=1 Tax=Candidatus Falkowbacteria bacterium CG10_big_fil_rev_8_21_14_0_10_43_11 TaxID=1974568 RepID=A0A2M6WLS7_9BACT|nr:MAG: site-2 protease family protein [Candidatus Falkowbacteria bacterium CG10_big_fil_rev_8_21_14_0_10_43_11]
MTFTLQLFSIIILILSASIHEYMHAWMADRLGDATARDAGRLTINPLAHLDWFGSIFLPLLLVLSNSPFVFGYAKPVPFNPHNLRDGKWGPAKVALAGPLGNFILALSFGLVLRFVPVLDAQLAAFISYIIIINLILMVFNLIPIPPLDGSKIILPFLPYHWQKKYFLLEPYGMTLVVFFMLLGMNIVWFFVNILFQLIVGG